MIYKTRKLGANLKEAKELAQEDRNLITEFPMRVKSIKLRKNSKKVRVQWAGREGELVKIYDVVYETI